MQVVRSERRRRTASAAVRDGEVVVRLPAHVDAVEADRLVTTLVDRLVARAVGVPPAPEGLPDAVARRAPDDRGGPRGDPWLVALADEVCDRWLPTVPRAARVTWSRRMRTRWASCTVTTRQLRVSTRLLDAPTTVVAHILLHELAHLVERGHGPAFRALLARDPAAPAVDAWLTRRDGLELAHVLRREGLLGGHDEARDVA